MRPAALSPGVGRPRVAEHLRFARKVLPTSTGCHYWLGSVADDGYGRFTVLRDGLWATVRASRWVWEFHSDRPPGAGRVVEHRSCDEPLCVRFEHLRESWQWENVAVAAARDRVRNGHVLGRSDIRGAAARSRALRAALREVRDQAETIGLERFELAVAAAARLVDDGGNPQPGQGALW